MKFTEQELRDIVDEQDPVSTGPWKHGSLKKYIVSRDGKHYAVSIPFHPYEGPQIDYPIDGHEVVPIERTITEWVRVPVQAVAIAAAAPKEDKQ